MPLPPDDYQPRFKEKSDEKFNSIVISLWEREEGNSTKWEIGSRPCYYKSGGWKNQAGGGVTYVLM